MLLIYKVMVFNVIKPQLSAWNVGHIMVCGSIVLSFPDVRISSWARLAGCFQMCNVEDFWCPV